MKSGDLSILRRDVPQEHPRPFQIVRFTHGQYNSKGKPVGRYRVVEHHLTYSEACQFINQHQE